MLEAYKGKTVAVLGFGIEGSATFYYLAKNGIKADIIDKRPSVEILKEYPELKKYDVTFVAGEDYLKHLSEYKVIFKTPGISPKTNEIKQAEQSGVIFTSQIEEFFKACPCPIIGITGTKGKGTTSTLIYEILKKSGRDVYLGGNIGVPAISFLGDLNEKSIVVLELSSFQLQVLKVSPEIAVVLNITQEHLDYHQSVKEYVESKSNILKFQKDEDIAVINADYETPLQLSRESKAKKYFFSKLKLTNGCYVDQNDNIILETISGPIRITQFSKLKLRGRHNLENITAASCAAYLAGASTGAITETVEQFQGLEHRLELVREIDGVKYYNDSFSTVPETAIAAIDSFIEPIILIAGGSSKNSDYTALGQKIAQSNIKKLILIGDTAEDILNSLPEQSTLNFEVKTGLTRMKEIVEEAKRSAVSGDIVLLSPACASFGLFKNYKDRGEQFKDAVKKL